MFSQNFAISFLSHGDDALCQRIYSPLSAQTKLMKHCSTCFCGFSLLYWFNPLFLASRGGQYNSVRYVTVLKNKTMRVKIGITLFPDLCWNTNSFVLSNPLLRLLFCLHFSICQLRIMYFVTVKIWIIKAFNAILME